MLLLLSRKHTHTRVMSHIHNVKTIFDSYCCSRVENMSVGPETKLLSK